MFEINDKVWDGIMDFNNENRKRTLNDIKREMKKL